MSRFQLCALHILREAKDAGRTSRQAHASYVALRKKFIHAKGPGPPEGGAAQHDILVAETRALAAAFREAGCESFATKLENASEFLYTFILYPGMESTSNLAERILRPSVIARKIFQGLYRGGHGDVRRTDDVYDELARPRLQR